MLPDDSLIHSTGVCWPHRTETVLLLRMTALCRSQARQTSGRSGTVGMKTC